MQKQKIDPLYLVLHSDYDSVFCGLFRGTTQLAYAKEHKIQASKNLMSVLVTLLAQESISWTDLDFIGVNRGPGPFTTLRVVITTINGLLFSHSIPLVGVDGLKAFVADYQSPELVVALLNAFNNDVYFAIKHTNGKITTGWEFNATFLHTLHTTHANDPITFIGNGITLHKEKILNLFPHASIANPLPATASFETIAKCAVAQWNTNESKQEPLLPLYLKTLEYKEST